ncbi:Uncharacterized protein TCM_016427 [Theobroma cacao]|uniref:Uncharacterized protein n=1 Tax=Theobroma cacao TaxID=3641 RepID=A0A061G5X9_THECC|nr:Uncharacterized protein TCM_016427 [Theobroma cacao]
MKTKFIPNTILCLRGDTCNPIHHGDVHLMALIEGKAQQTQQYKDKQRTQNDRTLIELIGLIITVKPVV